MGYSDIFSHHKANEIATFGKSVQVSEEFLTSDVPTGISSFIIESAILNSDRTAIWLEFGERLKVISQSFKDARLLH